VTRFKAPTVGADTFVVNEHNAVCLIKRSDNKLWALPGGCQELGETPMQCAVREFQEETGLSLRITGLLGVFSSVLYEYVHYPHKEFEFCHLFFSGEVIGGEETLSDETSEIAWFSENELPDISDGHMPRIEFGFKNLRNPGLGPHFE
jgi:8-oxo-dGTP pyrophosphatase MutT (NUDIX family)